MAALAPPAATLSSPFSCSAFEQQGSILATAAQCTEARGSSGRLRSGRVLRDTRWMRQHLGHSSFLPLLPASPAAATVDAAPPRCSRLPPPSASLAAVEGLKGLKQSLKMNKLGDSDLIISEVTLGTMTFGNQNSEKEAHEQLSLAFDHGVNILDTAEMYPVPPRQELQGRTDKFISTWLAKQSRDKVIVATKVAGYSENIRYLRESGDIPRVNAANVQESVEKSLKRLGTDHIDLLQIHWPDRYVPIFGEYSFNPSKMRDAVPFEEQLEALQRVIEQGKVRYIGVSNETSLGVMEFWQAARSKGLPKIVSIQNCYNLIFRTRFEVDLAEVCAPHNANVGLLVYSPLAGGVLSGKYLDPSSDAAKNGRLNVFPLYMNRYIRPSAQAAVAEYVEIARKFGLSPTQLALAFVRDRWFVTSNIIGATTIEQLVENLSAYMTPRPLADEINAEIDAVFQKYRDPSLLV